LTDHALQPVGGSGGQHIGPLPGYHGGSRCRRCSGRDLRADRGGRCTAGL